MSPECQYYTLFINYTGFHSEVLHVCLYFPIALSHATSIKNSNIRSILFFRTVLLYIGNELFYCQSHFPNFSCGCTTILIITSYLQMFESVIPQHLEGSRWEMLFLLAIEHNYRDNIHCLKKHFFKILDISVL